jgi:mannose-1-phosphate guanylyltransferase/phosphomannomutase
MQANVDALEGRIEGWTSGNRWGGIGPGKMSKLPSRLEGHLSGPSCPIKAARYSGANGYRDYTVVDNEAQIDRSILWRNCYIGERAKLVAQLF